MAGPAFTPRTSASRAVRARQLEELLALRNDRAQAIDKARDESLQRVLSTVDGQRVFAWLIFGFLGLTQKGWRPGAEIHAFAGRRDAGVELEAHLIRVAPDDYERVEAQRLALLREDREIDALERELREREASDAD